MIPQFIAILAGLLLIARLVAGAIIHHVDKEIHADQQEDSLPGE